MDNSKIYTVLLHFNRIEQNRLRKYIISPYFNKNQTLIQLFERLIKQINQENGKELTKEKLWIELYPDKPFEDVRYRKLCSDLLKLVEGFLAQETFEENSMHKANFLMEAVAKRKLEKLYQTCIITSNKLSKKYPYRSSDYYHHQYKFQVKRYELEFELQRNPKSNIEEIIQNLDVFYLSEKLKLTCDILSRKAFMSHNYSNLFIDEIIKFLDQNAFEDTPPVAIYYQIYLTYTQPEITDHYFKLKSLLHEFNDKFSAEELKALYTSLANYCIKKINRGSDVFLKELFELNIELLKKQILLTDGELSPWRFKNIVILSLRLGEFDWVEKFIDDYKSKIPISFRENTVSLSFTRLYFYQKRYEKVIDLLRTVEYDDISMNLDSKALLLLTYYETDEIEPLYSLMDSFRTYLNRKKEIPQQRRNSFLALIRIVKKITKIRPGDKKMIESVRKELTDTKGIAADKKWLLKKIAELE